jgi:beta-phosphoglucomutase
MIRAFIFDFDGILADTEELHYRSYLPVLEEKGLSFSYAEYGERYMAFDALGCYRQLAEDRGLVVGEAMLRQWVARKNEVFTSLVAQADVRPLPGAMEAVQLASSRGPTGVCTGAVLSDIDPLLDAFDIRSLLSAVVTADDVSVSKPDPESYALAAKRLGVDPKDCLAIEDTPGGLQSARGAGCQTLGVNTTHTEDDLYPHADRVIASLVDFPGYLATLTG